MRKQEEVEMRSMIFLNHLEVAATKSVWAHWRQYRSDIQKTQNIYFPNPRENAIIRDVTHGESSEDNEKNRCDQNPRDD